MTAGIQGALAPLPGDTAGVAARRVVSGDLRDAGG